MNDIRETVLTYLQSQGWSSQVVEVIYVLLLLLLIAFTTRIYIGVVDWLVLPLVRKVVARTSTRWDDYLLNNPMLNRLKHLLPPMVWYVLMPHFFEKGDEPVFLQKCCLVYLIICILLTISTFLNNTYDISTEHDKLKDRPLKGVYQMLKLAAYLIGGILIISLLIDRDASAILTGLGASAAVLLLIFKDSILGLVAGVQLNANNMLRAGDWITLPKHQVNGIVLEVNLTAVKVQNFDMTILTIPPYVLVSESFQNWRGMKESGGRRIMRSLHIDVQTVRFMDEQEVERLAGGGLLFADELPNERPLVNLRAFRIYAEKYLLNHPLIDNEMLHMVRQLQPTSEGIPIEIYCFAVQQDWKLYEGIQGELMEHLMAVMPAFGLRLYQQVGGKDLVDALSARIDESGCKIIADAFLK